MSKPLFLLLCCISFALKAQQRDTSFTTYSAYIKAKKTQPFIRIANPKADGVDSAMNLTYCSYGSRELKLDVFYPAQKTGTAPVVMLIHGGGWRSGDRSQHVAMARMLASKGFFAVTVEYRLSTEALYPAPLIDLKTAIRWIRTHASPYYPINNDKFAVWGFSAGGQLAALIGSTNGSTLFGGDKNSDVQAVVDVDGTLAFIHPESGEGNDSKGPSAATLWFGAPASAGTQKWEEAAALNHVSETNPPILFINSSVARMHAGRTDMIRKLDSLHVYSEVHELPDTQHTFPLFDPWFTSTLDYTVAFLNKIFGRS